MPRTFLLACLVLATLPLPRLVAREWTDATGAYKIEAEFVTFKDGKVYLEKTGGDVISLPLEKLSAADRTFLEEKPPVAEYLKAHPELAPAKPMSESSAAKKSTFEFVDISASEDASSPEVRRFTDMRWGVKSMAFSQDGGILAAGKQDKILYLFGLKDSQTLTMVEDLDELGQLTCCQFSPDNTKLIVGGSTGRVMVWKVDKEGVLEAHSQFYGHNGEIHCLTVSPDGKRVLSGDRNKTLKYWDLDTGEEVYSFDVFEGKVMACFITPSGKQGLGSDGASLILFDLEKGEAIQSMDLIGTGAHAVAISPDGKKVAVSDQYAINVWDTKSGRGFQLQDQEIQWTLGFSPDSQKILAGGRAKVSVWDLVKKNRVTIFDTGSFAYVQTIAVSPDNRHIAAIGSSAGQDIQVFRLPGR